MFWRPHSRDRAQGNGTMYANAGLEATTINVAGTGTISTLTVNNGVTCTRVPLPQFLTNAGAEIDILRASAGPLAPGRTPQVAATLHVRKLSTKY